MSLYVDTSALLKRYIDEDNSDIYQQYLVGDPSWITARHTMIETRRNLARLFDGRKLKIAQQAFRNDWARTSIAEITGARTLDALHLAAAQRVDGGTLPFLTADMRQAKIARDMGWIVLGV